MIKKKQFITYTNRLSNYKIIIEVNLPFWWKKFIGYVISGNLVIFNDSQYNKIITKLEDVIFYKYASSFETFQKVFPRVIGKSFSMYYQTRIAATMANIFSSCIIDKKRIKWIPKGQAICAKTHIEPVLIFHLCKTLLLFSISLASTDDKTHFTTSPKINGNETEVKAAPRLNELWSEKTSIAIICWSGMPTKILVMIYVFKWGLFSVKRLIIGALRRKPK